MSETINIKQVVEYWKNSAQSDYSTAKYLCEGKKYSNCLFFCHLMIEKILKGLIVERTKTHAPYIHKLVDLAKIAKVKLNEEEVDYLSRITEFNIACRYDAFKQTFYKKCDKKYTEKYFNISKKLYLWLKKEYQKK